MRNIIGEWGAGLGDADYACALAALGTLESRGANRHGPDADVATLERALEEEFVQGERTPIWRHAICPDEVPDDYSPDAWLETIHDRPDLLAEAWRRYRAAHPDARRQPRVALDSRWRTASHLFDFDALYGWLRHPAVGLGALILHDRRAFDSRLTWHWPLRVGVPAGADNRRIISALRAAQGWEAWIEGLSDVLEVGAGRDRCDLLVLTESAARDILDQPRSRIRASFVAYLGQQGAGIPSELDVLGTLGRRLHASGVGAVGDLDGLGLLGDWFAYVLRELSHDAPVSTAIYAQRPADPDVPPLLMGNARSLDRCRLLGLAEQQDRVAAALAAGKPRRDKPRSGPEPTFRGPRRGAGVPPAGGLQVRMADDLRLKAFTSESLDGVGTARDLGHRQTELDQAAEARWVQARSWRDDSLERPSDTLASDRWSLVAVHIGPSTIARSDAPFPDSKIDFQGSEVPVDVQLEVAGAEVAAVEPGQRVDYESDGFRSEVRNRLRSELRKRVSPPAGDNDTRSPGLASSTLLLPPVGNSTLALFAVHPHRDAKDVDARIAVVHANRILQTARVRIPVGESTAGDAGTQLDVVAEEAIHARDDDLVERREYDVAIQVSDIGGKLHLTVQRNGNATPVQLDDLGEPIKAIRDALYKVALQWDYSKPMLEQVAFSDVLYALAAHGTSLRQHLQDRCGDDIDAWRRIHLVPRTDGFLPLEYVYDGPPPSTDAVVCPNVVAALENAGCEFAVAGQADNTPCPNRSDKAYVCPLRFWGFHRLIERNGVLRDSADTGGSGGAVSRVCVPSKQEFGGVRSMVFAASDRTFRYESNPTDQKRERAELVDTLRALSGNLEDAGDWEAWRNAVRANPNLLVLVAHTDQHRGAPVLEIGDGKLLGRHEILPDVAGASDEPRMLILLGCSAAGVTEDFQPYPERFRAQGVSIVLAPVAPIRGADAVPIAKRLAELLDRKLAEPEPTAFGELLPLLRRKLLSEGHPGVMGILGFGDGDWLIGGR